MPIPETPASMQRVLRRCLLVVLVAAVAAVAKPATGSTLVGGPRILNGTPTAGHPEVAAVGTIDASGRVRTCSGTLIAPTVVLTAAHCLIDAVRAGAVFLPTGDPAVRLPRRARKFVAHPDYRGLPYADIGLVYLGSPAGAILPAVLADRRPRGAPGEIVGFGEDASGTALVKRTGSVKLQRHCPRGAPRKIGLRPRDLAASLCWKPQRGGSDTCRGDSGGPLFIDGKVAGVHAGGIARTPRGCPSVVSYSTDVAHFRAWIDAALVGEPGF